jgi:hypothetical protein
LQINNAFVWPISRFQNAAEAKRELSEGERATIGLRPPSPFIVIVRDKNIDGFLTTDGQTILYRDIHSINEGTGPFIRGDAWNVFKPLRDAEKALPLGQTMTISLKGLPPLLTTVTHKEADAFSAEGGHIVAYKDVTSVTRDIPLTKRIFTALIGIPFFLLWMFVEFMAMLGFH